MSRRSSGRPPVGATSIRDALLRSAATQFSRRGFAGANTRAILADAGVTAPALYHHFGNKTGLYVAAAAAAQEHVLDVFAHAVAGRDTVVARVGELIESAARLRSEHPNVAEYLGVIQQDVARHPELAELRSYGERFDDFWRGVSDGGSASVAIAVRALVEGLLSVGGVDLHVEDISSAAVTLKRIAERGLGTMTENL